MNNEGVAFQQYNKVFVTGKNNIVLAINIVSNNNDSTDRRVLSFEEIIKKNRQYVLNSLVSPWLASESRSFNYIYTNNLYIQPDIKINGEKKRIPLRDYLTRIDGKNTKTWVLGEAGIGKTTLLKHTFLEHIKSGEKGIYVTADSFDIRIHAENTLFYDNDIIFGDDVALFIDGIDEAFANNPFLINEFIKNLRHLDCEMWLGCRTPFFNKYSKELSTLSGVSITIQTWDEKDINSFISGFCTEENEVSNRINRLLGSKSYLEFCNNPLRLSMIIYIAEKTPLDRQVRLTNDYYLYSNFFELWVNNETKRLNNKSCAEDLYSIWYKVSRELYENDETVIAEDNSIINSLLNRTSLDGYSWKVEGFFHRSLMEFLLARKAIESMLLSSDCAIQDLKHNNRSDVDHFIKRGLETISYQKKNTIIRNLINAYYASEQTLIDPDKVFCVQNQIVYYLTRMKTRNTEPIINFLRDIYKQEKRPIMRQGIAYGAASLDLFDIALQFAKEMEAPDSEANIVNRSWTLVFYGDVSDIDVDPIRFRDDGKVPWDKARQARLRRFKGNSKKDKAFRMFDFCIMIGFYISRNWENINENDLKIIESCEVNINEFPPEINSFLQNKKQCLVNEYKKHLRTP